MKGTDAQQPIVIPATERSPAVSFDFEAGHFSFSGESYPEDAASFFGPLLESLRRYLEQGRDVLFEFRLVYFNSSSAKALMNIFLMLEAAAEQGTSVTVNWRYAADDEAMEEFGEDFASDLEHTRFVLCPDAEGAS